MSAEQLQLRLESSKSTALGIIPGTGTSSLKASPERLKLVTQFLLVREDSLGS